MSLGQYYNFLLANTAIVMEQISQQIKYNHYQGLATILPYQCSGSWLHLCFSSTGDKIWSQNRKYRHSGKITDILQLLRFNTKILYLTLILAQTATQGQHQIDPATKYKAGCNEFRNKISKLPQIVVQMMIDRVSEWLCAWCLTGRQLLASTRTK